MPEGDYEGAGREFTMTLMNLARCLEGLPESKDQYKFNWLPVDESKVIVILPSNGVPATKLLNTFTI